MWESGVGSFAGLPSAVVSVGSSSWFLEFSTLPSGASFPQRVAGWIFARLNLTARDPPLSRSLGSAAARWPGRLAGGFAPSRAPRGSARGSPAASPRYSPRARKRPANLSITHKFGCIEPKLDIGKSGEPAPHDLITRRRIISASKVTAKSG